ncbi:hypothetical protein ACQ27_gp165 [Klebsiella phage K64-1]|nr:hypothetical protein ACQ27_gp165 [Klebsiella phage K64-1]
MTQRTCFFLSVFITITVLGWFS